MPSCFQFVNKIDTSPTVVLDLDDGAAWSVQTESVIGMPELKRTIVGTLLTDGEQIPASAYGNRELSIVLLSQRKNFDDAATDLQAVIRQLDKPTNLLRYIAPGVSSPVFFRTFRGSVDTIMWDQVSRKITLKVPAEPFALGTVETAVSAVTVNNNPAAGSNGLYLDVNGIKGDVEVPLFIEHTGAGTTARPGLGIGVRRGPAPYPSHFRQAESMIMGTNTSVTADAAMSGGSKARCIFTNPALLTRLSGTIPSATAAPELRGEYRVFARMAVADGGTVGISNFRVQFGTGPAGLLNPDTTDASKITVLSDFTFAGGAKIVDLGVVSVATGRPATSGYDAVSYTPQLPYMYLRAQRLDSSDFLDIDYLAFVPAERFGVSSRVECENNATSRVVWDGPNHQVYSGRFLFTAAPEVFANVAMPSFSGVFPMAWPGDNRLVVVHANKPDPATGSDDLAWTAVFTIRYWPRYVHTKPLST